MLKPHRIEDDPWKRFFLTNVPRPLKGFIAKGTMDLLVTENSFY